MTETKIAEVKVGEMAEGFPWEIVADVVETSAGPTAPLPCHHCRDVRMAEPEYRHDGSQWNIGYRTWTVPRIVRAQNEGGHNVTEVCLDCILEEAAKLAPPHPTETEGRV